MVQPEDAEEAAEGAAGLQTLGALNDDIASFFSVLQHDFWHEDGGGDMGSDAGGAAVSVGGCARGAGALGPQQPLAQDAGDDGGTPPVVIASAVTPSSSDEAMVREWAAGRAPALLALRLIRPAALVE